MKATSIACYEYIGPIFRLAFLVAFLGVTAASLMPGDYIPKVDIWDKWLHLGPYAVLAFLAVPAFPARDAVWWIAAGLGVWGALIELAQVLVPGRWGADWLDATMNVVGIAFGLILAHAVKRVWQQRATTRQNLGARQ